MSHTSSVNLQLGINNTTLLLGQHGARAGWVELGTDDTGEPLVPVVVSNNSGTRGNLGSEVGIDGSGVTELTSKLETFTHEGQVSGVSEVARVDDWVIEGVGAVDVETTLTERMLQSSLDGDGSGGAQGQQDLNLTNGCEESVGSDIVDSLVTFNDSGIRAGNKLAGRIAQSTGD